MAYYVCGCEWRSSTSTGCTGQCLISRTGEHFAGFSHALPASSSTGVVETKVGGTRVCNTSVCLLSDMTVAAAASKLAPNVSSTSLSPGRHWWSGSPTDEGVLGNLTS